MNGFIYCLYSTEDGQPRYVSRTTEKVSYRFKQHVTAALEKESGAVNDWIRDVWRSGFDIAVYILQDNVAPKDLTMFEDYWFGQFKGLLNVEATIKPTDNSSMADQIVSYISDMLERSHKSTT